MRGFSNGFLLFLVFAAGCAKTCGASPKPDVIAEALADAGADAATDAGKEMIKEEKPVPDARIGYAKDNRLCTRLVSTKALRDEHCVETKSPIEQSVWIDAERIGALLENGSVVLWEISGAKLKELKVPPEKAFQLPAPLDTDGKVRIGVEASDRKHLWGSKSGELWLSRCPWWFMFDAGYCDAWVEARLYPPPLTLVPNKYGAPGYKESPHELPSGSPAPGISVEIQEPDGGGDITVVCKNGKTTTTLVEESHGSALSADIGWLGEDATQYLLRTELDFGEGTTTTLRLMKACSDDVEGTFYSTMSGPDAFWIHEDSSSSTVRYGAKVLGTIANHWIAFSP